MNIFSCSRKYREAQGEAAWTPASFQTFLPPSWGGPDARQALNRQECSSYITLPCSLHLGSWPKAREPPFLPSLRLQAKATSPFSFDFLVHQMEKRSTSGPWWFLPALHPLPLLLITSASFLLGEHPSFSVNVDTRLGLGSQNRDVAFSWSRHLVQGWVHELS